MTAESNAVVAELAYAHDSGSCEHNARAGSSPANCTLKALVFQGLISCALHFVLQDKTIGVNDGK